MITSIASGLLYSVNRRAVLEVLPPGLKKLWKDWDLRVAVLISLFLQIVLTILGNRRKSNGKVWIRALVWSAYTAADSVVSFALGINLRKVSDEFGCKGSLDPNIVLTTLWSQFLFLHLGGPDAITAYALQDNELWKRQAFGLVTQTCGALYIFFLAFTGGNLGLSILSVLIFIAGFIKYAERAWTLKVASEQLQRSLLLKNLANKKQKVSEPPNLADADYNREEEKLLAAYGLLDGTRRLFVDASLSPKQSRYMRETSKKLSAESAFQICEIQLGMMYDLLYSKGLLVFSKKGILLRVITFFISCFSVVFFSVFVDHKHPYSKIDYAITYVLLIVSVLLEIYAAMISLNSDWFLVWLAKKGIKISKLKTPFRIPRWSKKVTQYTLIKMLYKSKPVLLFTSFLGTEKYNQWNTLVDKELTEMIFEYLKKKADELGSTEGIKDMPFTTLPKRDSQEEKLEAKDDQLPAETIEEAEGQLNRTTEFEYKIVIWAIATEVLYYLMKKNEKEKEEDRRGEFVNKAKAIKEIARYMLYLLAKQPSMLSAQVDIMNPNFQDMAKASFFKGVNKANFNEILPSRFVKKEGICSVEGIVIYKAMKIVFNRMKRVTEIDMWKELSDFWLEMMAYSANRCPVNAHAQKLRYGGELLTHLWLLMANFGLTHHHFQSPTVGGLKFITDENKPRFALTKHCQGIHFAQWSKEELHRRCHWQNSLLDSFTFKRIIGNSIFDEKEFGVLLFRTLARNQNIEGDQISKEQLHQFCDQITDENFDNRLQLLMDMMDINGDGKISQTDIQEIIRVSAGVYWLHDIEEKAEEYAAIIMERFDPDNVGYITQVEEMQNLLRNAPEVIMYLDKPEDSIEEEESNLLKIWYQKVERFLLYIRRQSWILLLWLGIVSGLFTYKYVQYQNKAVVYNVMGNCICIAKGAAETLKFNMALMLLPLCSRVTPWLQNKSNLFGVLMSFNNNLKLHVVISFGVIIGVLLHSIAYLSCAFPRVIRATKEEYETIKPYFGKKQPENYWWFVKGVEGVTGIMMAIALVLAVCISILRSRERIRPWASWFSQCLCVTLYVILIVHGLYMYLIKSWYEKTIWMYLAIPVFLYICEWLIRILNSTMTIRPCKITLYYDIMALHMPKPSNFKFKSGQYMLVSCPTVSPFEWYPLYITSAKGENCLSFHVRTRYHWSSQLKAVLCEREHLDSSETVITAEQTKTKRFPKLKMDGPYGVPTEAYEMYDVVLLIVGEGMRVLPTISIIQNILAKESKDIESGNRKKVYFYWETYREMTWMNEMINQIAKSDKRGIIEFHLYYPKIRQGNASSALIWLVQSIVHEKTGVDVISNLSLESHLSHFGFPNWLNIFENIGARHTDTKVGVFFFGSTSISTNEKKLKEKAWKVSEKTTFHFDFYSEIDTEKERHGYRYTTIWDYFVRKLKDFMLFIHCLIILPKIINDLARHL